LQGEKIGLFIEGDFSLRSFYKQGNFPFLGIQRLIVYSFLSSAKIRIPNPNYLLDYKYMLEQLKSMSYTTIGIIVFSLLLILVAVYYISQNKQGLYAANREKVHNESSNGKTAELMLFSANWCPHCKTAKPVWTELSTDYEDKMINGYRIIFTSVDCSEETGEVERLMDKYKVEGFPTIKLIKDGQVYDFDAKPTRAALEQFLTSYL